jgi:YVTN family beta-propeller protein
MASEVAVTPNGAFAYISDSALFGGSSSISVINTRTNTVVATVPVGFDPQRLAFVPGGAFAYVANQLSNTVSVIETATN